MNETDRAKSKHLQSLSSKDAATFLIQEYAENYPSHLATRSWEVRDQIRLAKHFLVGKAYSSQKPYDDFLSFMSIKNFAKAVLGGLNEVPDDRMRLLTYYIIPSMKDAAKNDLDHEKIEHFASILATRSGSE